MTTLAVLKQISPLLVDIFGQNEQTYLLRNDNHINILDAFKSDETLLKHVSDTFSEMKRIDRELKKFGGNDYERERALSMLQFQIEELESAQLNVEEEEELLAYRKKAMNAERVCTALKSAIDHLGELEFCGINTVSAALNALTPVSDLDDSYEELRQRLESSKIEIQDIYHSLSDALNSFDFDPREVDKMEARLDKIKNLKRKYGGSIEKALEFLQQSKQAYDDLINADETIAQLKREKEKVLEELYSSCMQLTAFRKETAQAFETAIMNELHELGMQGATFAVQFNVLPEIGETETVVTAKGWDTVEFLFSANKGEPVKPLAKIASGGEMSRFMLAVKNITAKIENIPTMVFDEIDSGISGQMASVVAQKLAKISKEYQAVVITHLPQIACMGDSNYLVNKSVENNRTKTTVLQLDKQGKIDEVQRLIGGKDAGQFGGLHAKDMIDWADKFKQNL